MQWFNKGKIIFYLEKRKIVLDKCWFWYYLELCFHIICNIKGYVTTWYCIPGKQESKPVSEVYNPDEAMSNDSLCKCIRQNDTILKTNSLCNHIRDASLRNPWVVNGPATCNKVPRCCDSSCKNLTIESSWSAHGMGHSRKAKSIHFKDIWSK